MEVISLYKYHKYDFCATIEINQKEIAYVF